MTSERRSATLRRDLNDVFRDEKGHFTLTKTLGYGGQIIAGYLLVHHAEYVIDHGDAMAILLTFMIAPHLITRIINSKFPQPNSRSTVRQGEVG